MVQDDCPYEMVELPQLPYDGEPSLRYQLGVSLKDSKGDDPAEWPDRLRVREFPQ